MSTDLSTAKLLPSKLSLASNDEIDTSTSCPNYLQHSSNSTNLRVAQPASNFVHSPTISSIARPISHSLPMCESAYSSAASRSSELCDSTLILKQKNSYRSSETNIRCFACDTEKLKHCCLLTMRLAKVSILLY